MPRNIFLIGPQCAGKTTLLQELEKSGPIRSGSSGPPVIIHEVVRGVMAHNGLSATDFGTSKWDDLQMLTLEAQAHAEENTEQQWFISDRSGLDPLVYAQLRGEVWVRLKQSDAWKACCQRMHDALVIFCEAGNMAWLRQDDARLKYSDGQEWKALNDKFKKLLSEEDIPFQVLPRDLTDLEKRVDFVVRRWLG